MKYQFADRINNLKPSAIREILKNSDPNVISLAAGNPAVESFPVAEMQEIANRIFNEEAGVAFQYGITEGYPKLRELLRKRLSEKFHMGTDNDELLVVSGGQQAIDLATKVLCNEGDVVVSENPSFIGALNTFRSYAVVLKGVDVLDDGMDLEKLEETFKNNSKVKMLYIIPSFQNPLGTCTSLEKRKAIYDLCVKYGVIILEDNPYGELRFDGEDIPTLKSMDTEGIVIYCGSMSKVMSAGIRVGFTLAPKEIAAKMTVGKQGSDVHTNQFFQMLIADFMEHYDFDGHIEKIRALYKHKSGLMLDAIREYFPKEVKYTTPQGGLFLWCTLPEGADMLEFVQFAKTKGVAVVPGVAFNVEEGTPSRCFRLNYSTPSDEKVVEGTRILGLALQEFLAK
ncbi:MAG TPA: PLP-dependent aminotransferase family protein [Candidatus Merdivicinus excrementipullorum]|uniref:PLP-dependent aminotransferase family protein n=1 Tax=Candidatus Merdivicinus excrementipullorum TaxID=2840867 RepID=A0A9D1FNV4_9FIRM|nr:PLP-dependent aminotransferase family protein [Candidatus Merdivicinus excrementipullorum]